MYLVAHEDLEKFGSFNSQWLTSEAGEANGARFASLVNCESGVFTGRVIRQGAEE